MPEDNPRSLFSPSTTCILGIQLRLSGLVAHTFYLLSHPDSLTVGRFKVGLTESRLHSEIT